MYQDGPVWTNLDISLVNYIGHLWAAEEVGFQEENIS